jgi:hypothetical protein
MTYDSKKIGEQLHAMLRADPIGRAALEADPNAHITSTIHDGFEITFSEPGAGKRFIDKLAERFKKDSR